MTGRRGAALVVVLMCIALASALCAGGTAVARAMARGVRLSGGTMEVQGAAELVLAAALMEWDSTARAQQPMGVVMEVASHPMGLIGSVAWVTRIGDQTWWIVAEAGAAQRPDLRRRVGLVIHTNEGVPTPVPARAWAPLP